MGTRETIRQLVARLLEEQGVSFEPGDGEPLLQSGVLDSLSVMKIALFMEKEFGIDFSDVYFDQDDFNTVDAMVSFVDRHRPSSPGLQP